MLKGNIKKSASMILMAVLALAICACAKNSGENYTTYYPQCRQPILDMQSMGPSYGRAVKGAAAGGLVGGATGFFLGLLFNGGNLANAGISAAVGAATGSLTGGISGGMSGGPNNAEENMLLARYYDQIDGDISGLDVRQAAGTVAMQCYRKRLAELDSMEKSGKIAPLAADKRRIEIEHGMAQARELIGNAQNGNLPAEPEK